MQLGRTFHFEEGHRVPYGCRAWVGTRRAPGGVGRVWPAEKGPDPDESSVPCRRPEPLSNDPAMEKK